MWSRELGEIEIRMLEYDVRGTSEYLLRHFWREARASSPDLSRLWYRTLNT
jgi:hypothetical protein